MTSLRLNSFWNRIVLSSLGFTIASAVIAALPVGFLLHILVLAQGVLAFFFARWGLKNSPRPKTDWLILVVIFVVLGAIGTNLGYFWSVSHTLALSDFALAFSGLLIPTWSFIGAMGVGRMFVIAAGVYIANQKVLNPASSEQLPIAQSSKVFVGWGIIMFVVAVVLSIFGIGAYGWLGQTFFGRYPSGWDGIIIIAIFFPALLIGLTVGAMGYFSKRYKLFFLAGLMVNLVIIGTGVAGLYGMYAQRHTVDKIEYVGKLTSQSTDSNPKSSWSGATAYFAPYDYAGNGKFIPISERVRGELAFSVVPVKFSSSALKKAAANYLDKDQLFVLTYDEEPIGVDTHGTQLSYYKVYGIKPLADFEGQGYLGQKLIGHFANYQTYGETPGDYSADFIMKSDGKTYLWYTYDLPDDQAEGAWHDRISSIVQQLAKSHEEVTIQTEGPWQVGNSIPIKWIYGTHKP